MNVVVDMSTAPNTGHRGLFMENGSGGYMGDLVFNGGKFGMWVGNQQYVSPALLLCALKNGMQIHCP